MEHKLKFHAERPKGFPAFGDVWPLPRSEPFLDAGLQFRQAGQGKRAPLVVKLPDETELRLDAVRASADAGGRGYTLKGLEVAKDGAVDVAKLSAPELIRGRRGWLGHLVDGKLVDATQEEREAEQGAARRATAVGGVRVA